MRVSGLGLRVLGLGFRVEGASLDPLAKGFRRMYTRVCAKAAFRGSSWFQTGFSSSRSCCT